MLGKEDIEWKGRAWRLLENKGQVEWSRMGTVGGGAAVAGGMGSGKRSVRKVRLVVGSAGVGGTVGLLGYMASTYGVKGGSGLIDDR